MMIFSHFASHSMLFEAYHKLRTHAYRPFKECFEYCPMESNLPFLQSSASLAVYIIVDQSH